MNRILTLCLTSLALACAIPTAEARTRRPRIIKSIDISDDPAVKAAEQRRKQADDAVREAEKKGDKAAIEAARKEKEEATKALQETRRQAFEAAKKKANR